MYIVIGLVLTGEMQFASKIDEFYKGTKVLQKLSNCNVYGKLIPAHKCIHESLSVDACRMQLTFYTSKEYKTYEAKNILN